MMTIGKIISGLVISAVVFFVAAFVFSMIPGLNQPAGGGFSAVNGIGLILSLIIAGLAFYAISKK